MMERKTIMMAMLAPRNQLVSRREALIAASTIQKYIADTNEPFARKLEEMLASFGRHVRLEDGRAMQATKITDYLSRR